ncbi:N-formylglutamate amidohydrolase [Collimonas pratensis]|uniref:N-formylglutamate amidohydrolase n=1 Tax=Collimonas pratensis TaxID=279113 RepID=UPI00143DA143|nr:N-formylglutamate amidohydrolase [Collimonas pratensis]NKI70911.1 N-formylglutamate amidohydrolase [Collimonas pratensis]
MQDTYFLIRPQHSKQIPLIFDSPHSSRFCPLDMRASAPQEALMSGWDAYVDELWSGAPQSGATLLAAGVHRSYIDFNRARGDIDPELLEQPWPQPIQVSEKSKAGMGLIRRYALPGVPMYERKLSVAEVQQRIEHYYDPYHAQLKQLIDSAHARFGQVWHIDCHSMKSVGNAMNIDNGARRPDFVLGDRSGSAADPAFTQWVAQQLQALGYVVKINDPYRGAELVRAYSDPQHGRNSMQIEINRALYMNEQSLERSAGFVQLQNHLTQLAEAMSRYISGKLI